MWCVNRGHCGGFWRARVERIEGKGEGRGAVENERAAGLVAGRRVEALEVMRDYPTRALERRMEARSYFEGVSGRFSTWFLVLAAMAMA